MDKRKPHYALAGIKERIIKGEYRITRSALLDAYECFGFQQQDIVIMILNLDQGHFYKSMTTYHDTSVWQDVYHADICRGKKAYIKLQIADDKTIIISFKSQ